MKYNRILFKNNVFKYSPRNDINNTQMVLYLGTPLACSFCALSAKQTSSHYHMTSGGKTLVVLAAEIYAEYAYKTVQIFEYTQHAQCFCHQEREQYS